MAIGNRLRAWSVVVLAVAVLGAATTGAWALPYEIVSLNALTGGLTISGVINNHGQIAGNRPGSGGATGAFFWDPSTGVQELGNLGGGWSSIFGLNDRGQVVGYSRIGGSDAGHAFIWENGVISDLGALGGSDSVATGINDSGQVVGYSAIAGDVAYHGFIWENGVMTDLGGDPLSNTSEARGINTAGQVVGNYGGKAALWDHGTRRDIGSNGSGVDINDVGQVVGGFPPPGGAQNEVHPFIWDETNGVQDLGTFGGLWNHAWAINNEGQVVGDSADSRNWSYAFVWQGGTLSRLEDMQIPGSNWHLSSADDINDSGWIVGYGDQGGYLAKPLGAPNAVPEPASCALLALAAGGIGVVLKRRRKA